MIARGVPNVSCLAVVLLLLLILVVEPKWFAACLVGGILVDLSWTIPAARARGARVWRAWRIAGWAGVVQALLAVTDTYARVVPYSWSWLYYFAWLATMSILSLDLANDRAFNDCVSCAVNRIDDWLASVRDRVVRWQRERRVALVGAMTGRPGDWLCVVCGHKCKDDDSCWCADDECGCRCCCAYRARHEAARTGGT